MASSNIDRSASVDKDARLEVDSLTLGPWATVEAGAVIEGSSVVLGPGARIGSGTTVRADEFRLGFRSSIRSNCTISGIGGRPSRRIDFGDNSMVGESTNILVPELIVGDYVALHHHSLVSGYERCSIGHNTWIGQNAVLNSTSEVAIGNNVGFGAYSSVYTHAYNGELLEGCQIWSVKPVVIEDNAWIVGCYNVISPGVTVGRRGVILTGSVVSKDVEPAHLVAGVPAKDLTDRLMPFKELTSEEKVALMRRFVREFVEEAYPATHEPVEGGFRIKRGGGEEVELLVAESYGDAVIATDRLTLLWAGVAALDDVPENVVLFDISTKQYTKRLTDSEIEVIRFMNGFRARFVPASRPRVI